MSYEESKKRDGYTGDEALSRRLVSVCCLSYNHGAYLKEALDSFLMQEGDFDLEILIHDDASGDNSQDIIREYERRFPAVIKPIYQSENQFSKGITNPSGVFNFPRARGAYIAMCEGDDYWIDKHKLKRQLEFMDTHGDYAFICHAARVVYSGDAYQETTSVRPYFGTGEISPGAVISKKTNIPMASLFFRREYAADLPDWYFSCPVGDVPLQLHLIERGKAMYIDEELSAYRLESEGSWGSGMDTGEESEIKKRWESHYQAMEELYGAFNKETMSRWKEYTEEALRRLRFMIDLKEGRAQAVLDPDNRLFVSELPGHEALLQSIKARSPRAYELIRGAYRFMSGA